MMTKREEENNYPQDSQKSEYQHSENLSFQEWMVRRSSIVIIIACFFVITLIVVFYLSYSHINLEIDHNLSNDKFTANHITRFIAEEERSAISLLQSYAHRVLFVDAVKRKDAHLVRRHLVDLKGNQEVDLLFITDPQGVLWMNYPFFPEAIGRDLSSRDWYKGVSSTGKPYISSLFQLIVRDEPLAFAIAVPVLDARGVPVGYLASSQRLDFLAEVISSATLSTRIKVQVIDKTGSIIFSNNLAYRDNITNYPELPLIAQALQKNEPQVVITDHYGIWPGRYLVVVPAEGIGWTIIVEREFKDIVLAQYRYFAELLAIGLFLLFGISAFLVYSRQTFLLRKTRELMQAEMRLRESEDKFKYMFDNSTIGKSITFPDGKVNVNAAFSGMVGYSQEEINQRGWRDITHPEDIELTQRAMESVITGGENSTRFTKRFIHKNSSVVWADVSSSLRRDKDSSPLYFMTTLIDITELKRSEAMILETLERLNLATSAANLGIWDWDIQKDELIWDDRMYELYGVKRENFTAAYEAWLAGIHPDDRAASNEISQQAVRGERVYNAEFKVVWPDGTIHHLKAYGLVERDSSGKPLRMIGINYDITASKKAEEEASKFNEELEKRVAERTADLERVNKVFVDRELRMRELKARIAELEKQKT